MSKNLLEQKILLVTRPLCAPWDEASKNFAFDLAKNVTSKDITILTKGKIENLPNHIRQESIYSKSDFNIIQKIFLLLFLYKNAKNYDIIHLLFTPTKLNSWIITNLIPKNKKVIQTIATVRDDNYSKEELRKIYFADTLVTYSKFAKKKVSEIFRNNSQKNILQIYPGINLAKFVPGEKDKNLLSKWSIEKNHVIIAYAGEFVRLGATDLIVDTFIDIWKEKKNRHLRYLCACRIKNEADLEKKQEVIEKFKKAGYLDKVIFSDTFADMNALYNVSDIMIFPVTQMKGKFDVPLAMIEPYACKKPVIASDLPIFEEFSSKEINVIIKNGDKNELKEAILGLAKDTKKRKELGENSYEFVHKTFNISEIAKKYTKLYDKLQKKH